MESEILDFRSDKGEYMNIKKKLLIVLALIVAAGGYYYVSLPAFNIHSSDTWMFVVVSLAVVVTAYAMR